MCAPVIVVAALIGGFPSARLAQGYPLGYHKSSTPVASCYVHHTGGARSPSVHVSLWLCVACSPSHVASTLPASSTLRVAVPVSWHDGPSTCTSSCVAVDSSATCSRYW